MLHYLDDLDSKMESMRAHLEREADLDSPWTGYNASLGRPFLKREKFLEKTPVPSDPETSVSNAIEILAADRELEGAPAPLGISGNGTGKASAATRTTVAADNSNGTAHED